MAHKCLRCGNVYSDNDNSILNGCKCGSVFFMYFKKMEDLQKFEEMERNLKKKKTTLERELEKKIKAFDIETIRIPKEGVYEINMNALMNGKPLIIHERERIYFIHLPSVFDKIKR